MTSRGRPDLAPEVRCRTFTGTEPAPRSLGTRSLPADAHPRLVFMRHSLTPNPAYQPLRSTSASGSKVVQSAASRINDADYRKREREVKVVQASVRGFLARKHYAKLHAKPKVGRKSSKRKKKKNLDDVSCTLGRSQTCSYFVQKTFAAARMTKLPLDTPQIRLMHVCFMQV